MNYADKQNKEREKIEKSLSKLEQQSQKNLNSRLDKMRFRNYTETQFNGSKPHSSTDISFVTATDGTVSLYKGDTLLSGEGSFDCEYAALTGWGTGMGGERTGRGEVRTVSADYRDQIGEGNVLYSYTDSLNYWTNANGYTSHYSYEGETQTLDVRGFGTFRSDLSTENYKTCYIICQGTKAIINPSIKTYYFYNNEQNSETSLSSFLVDKTFYLRRGSSGARESINFKMEIYGIYFGHASGYSRISDNGTPQYRIAVTRTTDSGTSTRYLTKIYSGPTTGGQKDENTPAYSGCGFLLGFEKIQKTDNDLLYGQLLNPTLVWNKSSSRISIEETADDPYGFFYDLDTGAELDTPYFEFYNDKERAFAYGMM